MIRRNAIILAAGTASRFVPLSVEIPKGLLPVKGEVLIERQIRQLHEAGIFDITVVVGYQAEKFDYLRSKFGIELVFNEDYYRYNNTSSLIRVVDRLHNTFICSSDNYFPSNIFLANTCQGYYSALFAEGTTKEYCLEIDREDNITSVSVGGSNAWYMVGHVYFSEEFSRAFSQLLVQEYEKDETKQGYWEDLYIRFIDLLPQLKINRYKEHEIEEFDSLEELRLFDVSYVEDTRSSVLKDICRRLGCREADLKDITLVKHQGDNLLFTFRIANDSYRYDGSSDEITRTICNEEHMYDLVTLRQHLSEIFSGQDVSTAKIVRIGGMSNKNFRVDFSGRSYVLRVPGNGSDGMVDRYNEEFNALESCKLGINPSIRYFCAQTGIKLADYIENAETLTSKTIQLKDNMDKIALIYQTLHNSLIVFNNEFNIFREIEKYDLLLSKSGADMYDGWQDVRRQVMSLEDYLNRLGTDLKPCHNDALYENFIKAPDGTLYLIDWEYSGMNDPMADFAALFLEADFEEENERYILNRYFSGRVPADSYRKILCYQILWDYLWSQWTVIKESKGDDFGTYGQDRFNRAINHLDILKKEIDGI